MAREGAGDVRLRQVAVVVRDLEAALGDFRALLGLEVSFRDPGVGAFGLVNAVLPVGDTFLEVLAPARPDTSAGRFLERRGGDAGYMVIFQADDLRPIRRRAEAEGVRVVWEVALADAATIHLHPRDLGGAIVSVDWMDPPGSWRWAGPDWRAHVRSERAEAITGVVLGSADPRGLAERWARVLGRAAVPDGPAGACIGLDAGSVRFEPGRGEPGRAEGLTGVRVRTRDPERIRAAARERGLPVADGVVTARGVRLLLDRPR